jgi:hypothetical protein
MNRTDGSASNGEGRRKSFDNLTGKEEQAHTGNDSERIEN